MKIKRLNAANIREAMRKIREELGPDAVILSNQRSETGFEIIAAVDYDEKLLQGMQLPATLDPSPRQHAAMREIDLLHNAEPNAEAVQLATQPLS